MQAAFEDVEFCVRARKTGVPVTYDPDAIVRHHYDCTWLGLFRCGTSPFCGSANVLNRCCTSRLLCL